MATGATGFHEQHNRVDDVRLSLYMPGNDPGWIRSLKMGESLLKDALAVRQRTKETESNIQIHERCAFRRFNEYSEVERAEFCRRAIKAHQKRLNLRNRHYSKVLDLDVSRVCRFLKGERIGSEYVNALLEYVGAAKTAASDDFAYTVAFSSCMEYCRTHVFASTNNNNEAEMVAFNELAARLRKTYWVYWAVAIGQHHRELVGDGTGRELVVSNRLGLDVANATFPVLWRRFELGVNPPVLSMEQFQWIIHNHIRSFRASLFLLKDWYVLRRDS